MTSISIPDLEDELKARLSQQAARHGRSIEDEAHDILRKALGEERTAPPNLAAAIRARFAALGGVDLPESPREDIREPPNFETMIILDTNVISEMMKAKPDAEVEAWLASQPPEEIFISTVTEAELRFGVQLLPTGRRRNRISAAVDAMLGREFANRILPFDSSAAVAYAEIAAQRRLSGRPISQSDAQIAAIAKSQNAGLATRNVTDFEGCGLRLIDPWAAKTAS